MNLLRIYLVIGLIAASGLAYGFWHHAVYKSGYNACEASFKLASDKQKDTAQKEITKIGDKYEEIRTDLRKNPDYMRPVSPLVGSAISRMPNRTPAK